MVIDHCHIYFGCIFCQNLFSKWTKMILTFISFNKFVSQIVDQYPPFPYCWTSITVFYSHQSWFQHFWYVKYCEKIIWIRKDLNWFCWFVANSAQLKTRTQGNLQLWLVVVQNSTRKRCLFCNIECYATNCQ